MKKDQRPVGIEPSTSRSQGECSTAALQPRSNQERKNENLLKEPQNLLLRSDLVRDVDGQEVGVGSGDGFVGGVEDGAVDVRRAEQDVLGLEVEALEDGRNGGGRVGDEGQLFRVGDALKLAEVK